MQQPIWKKWLSYVKEISLEQTYSVYNPHLEVLLVEGRHQLAVSYTHLTLPTTPYV